MELARPAEHRSPTHEAIRAEPSGDDCDRCAYGHLVALELARLRSGPILGETPERERLRARIGRWYGNATASPLPNGGPRSRRIERSHPQPAQAFPLSAEANCVLS